MLPVSLLIALAIAFGISPPRAGVPASEVALRVLETCGGISLMAILSLGLGLWIASRVSHGKSSSSHLRRRYAMGVRVLTATSLLVFAWIIHWVGWPQLVRTNWGLSGWGLVDDAIVFLPYVFIQLLVWWGQYFAERALQIRIETGRSVQLGRYLLLRSRQSIGLILPVVLLFVIRRDVITPLWPGWEDHALSEPIEIAVLGSMVLMASPFFVRLAWPTRSLPPGPLRRRLERVAQRAGFRFADILVWDTGNTVLNACVTGILPRFRYVLLTDALIESMSPLEVAAVFGHEIGHIAHRHLLYFGFFFAGSLGVLTLLAEGVDAGQAWLWNWPWLASLASPLSREIAQATVLLILLGAYFWMVFGHLSRRFERQADIFGSKIVSCDEPDCPPHLDLDHDFLPEPVRASRLPLCPMGLRIFSEALDIVAQCNGLDRNGRSWRHGSIASRIAFLERLRGEPERERRFQREVGRLRLALAIALILALVVAAVRQSGGG